MRLCNLLKEIPTEEKLLKKMAQEDSWWGKKNRVSGLYQLGLDVDKILGQASAYQKKNHAIPEGQKTISCPRKLPPHPPPPHCIPLFSC